MEKFDLNIKKALGHYDYALIDPFTLPKAKHICFCSNTPQHSQIDNNL
jgi:hypothetical protein